MFQLLCVLYLGQYIFVIQGSLINLFVIDIGGSVDCLFNGQAIHIFGSIMESGGLPRLTISDQTPLEAGNVSNQLDLFSTLRNSTGFNHCY